MQYLVQPENLFRAEGDLGAPGSWWTRGFPIQGEFEASLNLSRRPLDEPRVDDDRASGGIAQHNRLRAANLTGRPGLLRHVPKRTVFHLSAITRPLSSSARCNPTTLSHSAQHHIFGISEDVVGLPGTGRDQVVGPS